MLTTDNLIFWGILAVIFVVITIWFHSFGKRHNFNIKWHHSVIFTAILYVFVYIFKNFLTTLFDYEMQGISLTVLLVGVPVVIVLLWIRRKWKLTKKAETEEKAEEQVLEKIEKENEEKQEAK